MKQQRTSWVALLAVVLGFHISCAAQDVAKTVGVIFDGHERQESDSRGVFFLAYDDTVSDVKIPDGFVGIIMEETARGWTEAMSELRFCTGFLFTKPKNGRQLAMTAGHCVFSYPQGGSCQNLRAVFGFESDQVGEMGDRSKRLHILKRFASKAVILFPKTDVYSCLGVPFQEKPKAGQEGIKPDWALLVLKPLGPDRWKPLTLYPAGANSPLGTKITAIGHPFKLVQQKAEGEILAGGGKFVLRTNLSLDHGNSGGPVMLKEGPHAGEVVGIAASFSEQAEKISSRQTPEAHAQSGADLYVNITKIDHVAKVIAPILRQFIAQQATSEIPPR